MADMDDDFSPKDRAATAVVEPVVAPQAAAEAVAVVPPVDEPTAEEAALEAKRAEQLQKVDALARDIASLPPEAQAAAQQNIASARAALESGQAVDPQVMDQINKDAEKAKDEEMRDMQQAILGGAMALGALGMGMGGSTGLAALAARADIREIGDKLRRNEVSGGGEVLAAVAGLSKEAQGKVREEQTTRELPPLG